MNFRLRQDFDDSEFNERFNAAQRTIVAARPSIDSQSFSSLSVDDFDVVDHGSEVELTYDCVRQP